MASLNITPLQQMRQGHGQDKWRSGAVFHDQLGRPYAVDLDSRNKNFHPVGLPIPMYKAPMYPPVHLIKPHPDKGQIGRLWIDFEQWYADVKQSENEWDQELRAIAKTKFPSNALDVVENPPRALLVLVGPRPLPSCFLRAMRVNNPWITGRDPDADPRQWFTESEMDAFYEAKAIQRGGFTMPDMGEDFERFGAGTLGNDIPEYIAAHPEDAALYGAEPVEAYKPPKPNKRKPKRGKREPSSYQQFVAAQCKQGKTLAQAAQAWKARKVA